jgi:hypothetical protein
LLFARLRDRVAGITGVQNVQLRVEQPDGRQQLVVGHLDWRPRPDQEQSQGASWNRVGPKYFETVGTARPSRPRI